jgi:hypothetical protein
MAMVGVGDLNGGDEQWGLPLALAAQGDRSVY